MNIPARYGLGFMRPDPLFTFSPSPRALGFMGLTSTLAFADPDADLVFVYFTRKQGYYGVNDPREKRLREEVYRIIAESSR